MSEFLNLVRDYGSYEERFEFVPSWQFTPLTFRKNDTTSKRKPRTHLILF